MANRIGDEAWLERVNSELRRLLGQPNVPVLDLEWLLLRCEDSQQYEGQWRQASLRQLAKDLLEFDRSFPGLLARDLLPGL